MRTIFTLLLTVCGLVSIYLFATGALGTLSRDPSWTLGLDLAARPFLEAGPLAFLVLGVGVACFAVGVIVSPQGLAPEARGGSATHRSGTPYSLDKLLEVFLAFNVIIVAALLGFISIGVLRSFPALTVGNLFVISAVGVCLGFAISILLYFRRKPAGQKIRPIYSVAVCFNLLEAFLMVLILLLGCV